MDIYLGILSFTNSCYSSGFVMFARSQLVSTGEVSIEINGDPEKSIKFQLVETFKHTSIEKYLLASACGGGGTCAECKCQVTDGGGSIFTEQSISLTSNRLKIGDYPVRLLLKGI